MEYTMTSRSLQDTHELAQQLAKLVPLGSVVVLEGMLGSGKTTFTQGFGKALGVQRAIKSPTYTIVKDYSVEDGVFVHIDAYRLEDGGADTIDLDSYMTDDAIIFIEWAQFVADYLPLDYLCVRIEAQSDSTRRITISSIGNDDTYHQVVQQLMTFEKEEQQCKK